MKRNSIKEAALTEVVKAEQTPEQAATMKVLQRAAATMAKPVAAPVEKSLMSPQAAWAAYRRSVTEPKRQVATKPRAEPPPTLVPPLSRREQRPTLSYVRMLSTTSFEIVSHQLILGELQPATTRKFSGLAGAYEQLTLELSARWERDRKVLADHLADLERAKGSGQ